MEILTVDFNASDAQERFVESLHNTGFAVIKNHPLSIDLLQKVYSDWEQFFAGDDKNDYLFNEKDQEGFFPMDVSEVAKGFDIKDIKEYYHFFPWGRTPKNVGPETLQLRNDMTALAETLLNWIEAQTPDEVKAKFSMPLSQMPKDCPRTLLRVLHYPPLQGDEQAGAIRAADHEDINLITILPAATDSGLQLKNKEGKWVDVPCEYGTIAVNIGDMLQECSGHYYPSTTHRVVNPNGEAAKRSRLSLPLFLHANQNVRLSDRYPTAKDYWDERLREIGVVTS